MYTLRLDTVDEVAVLVAAARLGATMATGDVTDGSALSLVAFVSAPQEAHAGVVQALQRLMKSASRDISAERN